MNSDSIDTKYMCNICQEVLNYPIKTIKKCNHSFCSKCIDCMFSTEANDKDPHKTNVTHKCPNCRTEYNQNDIIINDSLYFELSGINITCKCRESFPLNTYNFHSTHCFYQLDSIDKAVQEQKVKDAKPTINRDTFNCTLCSEKNFDRKGMVNHIKNKHPKGYGVCPICIVQPWGDPNYKTYLNGHCERRHHFDYQETVDYNEDEDEVLKQVLLMSQTDK